MVTDLHAVLSTLFLHNLEGARICGVSILFTSLLTTLGLHVCMVSMALITALVLCARSQDSLLLVSERRVHVVIWTAGFMGRGKLCPKTCETAALRRGIQKAPHT